MAIAPDVAQRVADAVLGAVPREYALAMLEALANIDGGPSFNDSVRMVRDRIEARRLER